MAKPHEIATWRFEQIAPALDSSLTPAQQQQAIRDASAHAVDWPRSEAEIKRGDPPRRKAIARSTLYLWMKQYRAGGLDALSPERRADHGQTRVDRSAQIDYAMGLLLEEPGRSLTQLVRYLELEFDKQVISRSTLSRGLCAHSSYALIKELRTPGKSKPRDRYQADYAHECWQLDGKGPFTVQFTDGTTVRVKVLSILDCYSRAVLAAMVANEEDIPAAVAVFTLAVRKYGVADRLQMDRGSAFDSLTFRSGLAQLGVHRNRVKAQNPPAQGIVEAYHRSLGRWFINELQHQQVHDLQHLQALLDAFIAEFYNKHRHDEIKTTPVQRLAGRMAKHRVSDDLLRQAFWVEVAVHAERKTGKVKLPVGLYRVSSVFAGARCTLRYDPTPGGRVVLVTADGRELELAPFEVKPLPPPVWEPKPATGQLQKLYDVWQGKERPNAQPGFGLPEVLRELGNAIGRAVPASKADGERVRAFYRQHGPLPREAFLVALERTAKALGPGRPLAAYLDDLERQVSAAEPNRDPPTEDIS